MFIRVHVYDDGDTELTKVAHRPSLPDDLYFDELGELDELKEHLRDCGHEDDRINEAIAIVMNEEEHEPVLV